MGRVRIQGGAAVGISVVLALAFSLRSMSRGQSQKPSDAKSPSPWEEGLQAKIPESPQLLRMGKQVYQTSCFVCHGKTGDGQGSASRLMRTKPRNFTSGKFKLRSTSWGTLPTDEDIFKTVTLGFPSYGMPSFKHLSAKERWAVIYYIKNMMLESGRKQGQPIDLGPEPPMMKESAERGKRLYEKFGCAACHGTSGKADGPLARYFPKRFEGDGGGVMPRDFTKGRVYFKSGGAPRDIARTLATGFEGTRMVPYLSALEDPKDLKPLWDLANYIYKISNEEETIP